MTSDARSINQISNPFTHNWIQSLVQVADNPLARTIKPKLDWINTLSRSQPSVDRDLATHNLWSFADTEGLSELLNVLPIHQMNWVFDNDDVFLYRRSDAPNGAQRPRLSQDEWKQAIGLQPNRVPLTAEVTHGDWTSLVRREAVRLQKPLNTSAVTQASTMHLPCTANWDAQAWSVQFDQLDWIRVAYDDLPRMPRPSYSELEEPLTWCIARANESIVSKKAAQCSFKMKLPPWLDCVDSLQPLHETLLQNESKFSAWLLRCWCCVWPIIYREQNVLRGKADLDTIRTELKECLTAQPRLSVWMFVFAKLVCQTQFGTGLGFCADFRD